MSKLLLLWRNTVTKPPLWLLALATLGMAIVATVALLSYTDETPILLYEAF